MKLAKDFPITPNGTPVWENYFNQVRAGFLFSQLQLGMQSSILDHMCSHSNLKVVEKDRRMVCVICGRLSPYSYRAEKKCIYLTGKK